MEVVSYKCPSCGAVLSFDADSGLFKCDFCASTYTLEDMAGTEAVQFNAEPEVALPSHITEEGAVFNCPNCGGRVITDINTTASFCAYCHNPTVIASRMADEFRPEQIIPFALSKAKALEEFQKFCKRFPLLPKDFAGFLSKGEITGLYVPYWLFDGHVEARMLGEGKIVTSWSDSKKRYTKTDTYHVEREANGSFVHLPADGSQKLDDKLMTSLEPFNYESLQDFNMTFLSGFYAESYDLHAQEVATIAKERMENGIRSEIIKGSTYSTLQVKAFQASHSNNTAHYVLMPVWLLSGQYNGKIYNLAINGQTGKTAGALPIDKKRYALFTLIGFITVLAIAYAFTMAVTL